MLGGLFVPDRDEGIAEDDSLAENVERVGLHPLKQFRAFRYFCKVAERGKNRSGAPRGTRIREAAAAAGVALGESARDVWRRWHDARTADGNLDHRSRPPRAGLGADQPLGLRWAPPDPAPAHRTDHADVRFPCVVVVGLGACEQAAGGPVLAQLSW